MADEIDEILLGALNDALPADASLRAKPERYAKSLVKAQRAALHAAGLVIVSATSDLLRRGEDAVEGGKVHD